MNTIKTPLSLVLVQMALCTGLLAKSAPVSAMEFAQGENVALCEYATGGAAGMDATNSKNSYDFICREKKGKIAGPKTSDNMYPVTTGTDTVLWPSEKLGKMTESAERYGVRLQKGRSIKACSLARCYDLKIIDVAETESHNAFVLFEGFNFWIYQYWLKDERELFNRVEFHMNSREKSKNAPIKSVRCFADTYGTDFQSIEVKQTMGAVPEEKASYHGNMLSVGFFPGDSNESQQVIK